MKISQVNYHVQKCDEQFLKVSKGLIVWVRRRRLLEKWSPYHQMIWYIIFFKSGKCCGLVISGLIMKLVTCIPLFPKTRKQIGRVQILSSKDPSCFCHPSRFLPFFHTSLIKQAFLSTPDNPPNIITYLSEDPWRSTNENFPTHTVCPGST